MSKNVLYLSWIFHLHISAVRNIIEFIHALNGGVSQHLQVFLDYRKKSKLIV